ncbi:MAG TPA: Sir2 family NAD-dependent protein deacetylase [Candidatus Paceibacterota bacterium]|nr:Sir2 family NAD-dependent protein deacetylase [Candidatus Paceibacterota bacterium]HRU35751.1 Sir2 family NAD-dependent protein deacetylase [Candidatus Paceibacterota bacterium]
MIESFNIHNLPKDERPRERLVKFGEQALFEGPELVSPEEEKKHESEMTFSFSSDTRRYYFGHKKGRSFFMVEYFDSLPDELTETEKEKFTKETRKQGETEKVVYVLKYGEVPESSEEMEEPDPSQSKKYKVAPSRDFERGMINSFIADDANKQVMSEILANHSKLSPEEISQIVEQTFEAYRKQDYEAIRVLSSSFSEKVDEMVRNEIRERMLPKPKEIEIAQLVEILKDKKVLFYTGAGISIASGVHDMDQLQKNLGIEMSQKVDDLLKKAVANPQSVIDSWEEFIKAAFEKPATPAHQSLKTLAQKLKSQIFTENVDHLQERAGVKATHLTGSWLKENVQPEWLKDIDVVITVGLSCDERGFLGWYKENNPNGKIVAVNLNQPPYLGNEDYILKGDCQKVIPELEKEFAAKEEN